MGGGADGLGYDGSSVVNGNWNGDNAKWNANAYDRDDNRWNAGGLVFSPETADVLPHSPCGSFRFQALLPSADHASELVCLF